MDASRVSSNPSHLPSVRRQIVAAPSVARSHGVRCRASTRAILAFHQDAFYSHGGFPPSVKWAVSLHRRPSAALPGHPHATTAGRSGKDSVDHAPRAHDDIANTVAGALVTLAADVRPVAAAFQERPLRRLGRIELL